MQELVKLTAIALKIGLVVMVFGLGLKARWDDVMFLFHRPLLLAKSLLARNVIMPFAAVLLVTVFRLEPIVSALLLALSVTAIPPFLPIKQDKAGGRQSYNMGLLSSQMVLAIVLIPVSLEVIDRVMGTQTDFSPRQVAANVGQLVLLPLTLGMMIGHLAPTRRGGLIKAASWISKSLLLVSIGIALVISAKGMLALIGNGTLLAMALFVVIGLAVGHVLGGPRLDDRTALALASASSHPGLAIAVVVTSTGPRQAPLAVSALLLYLIVSGIVTRPYIAHQKARQPTFKLSRSGVDRRRHPRVGPDRRVAAI